ncbi:MAG TPA: hypothetical protein VFG60_09235, partial [Burkholderiaceae bacterium]|nr:hypothetical protein [Burkholderiaceae bacterium]
SSDVGPYRELLFIPGSVRFSDGRRRTISRIYVSTQASAVNARANWGIPKEHGDFEVRYGADGVDEVSLSRQGRAIAALRMRHCGLRLPFNGAWIPRRLRMLGQRLGGKEYTYAPAARGHVKPAQLLAARLDARYFPALAPEHVLFAVKATDFEMSFPAARVRVLP